MTENNELLLSMEVPIAFGDSPIVEDIGFCISNFTNNYMYKRIYDRYISGTYNNPGKDVIIDNGAYDVGESLSCRDLIRIYEEMTIGGRGRSTTYLICPDVVGDQEATIDLAAEMQSLWKYDKSKLGVVVIGDTLSRQIECYLHYINAGFKFICLSFLYDRPTFLRNMPLNPSIRHHLLGCYGLDEISFIRHWISLPPRTSIDTVKAFKAGYCWNTLHTYQGNGTKWSIDMKFDPDQRRMALYNNYLLYDYCHAPLWRLPRSPYHYERPLTNRSDARSC